jgi:alkylation response protein AidB-like acyl-CoA dehydrogenase
MQAEVRAAASYVTEVAQRVTTVAFQAAGGGALFDTNPLQRCFRNVYAAWASRTFGYPLSSPQA